MTTAHLFHGTFTALVTPFRNGSVDTNALCELVEKQLAGGVEGLVPCGTTGESVTLSEPEHEHVVRTVVAQTRGRVPVVAGAGTASTSHTIALARIARAAKADGILVVTPYYNRPTQTGLIAHFRALHEAVGIPTIVYNIPVRTGVDVTLDTFESLAAIPSIVAVKEATGNILRSQSLIERFGDRFAVLSGDDALTLGVLAVGGVGVVSVASNIRPRAVSEIVRLFRRGSIGEARQEHLRCLPLYESLFLESNPGPVKGALAASGVIAPEIRLPLVWPSEPTLAKLSSALLKVPT